MAEPIVLSDEELAIIQKHRDEKTRMQALLAKRCEALDIASRYYAWLITHGRVSSFSTFVDEFGYQSGNAKRMYAVVCELIHTAETWD